MAALVVIAIAAFCYAGTSDYNDAIITEMKNNGTYWQMTEEHPDWEESQMIDYYEANIKNK